MGNTVFSGSNQWAFFSLIFQDFLLPGLVFIALRDEIASADNERVTLEDEQLNHVPVAENTLSVSSFLPIVLFSLILVLIISLCINNFSLSSVFTTITDLQSLKEVSYALRVL